ncbi:MAG: hypothetical protein GX458_22960 [Phyllobacteriaceae bacterium]|nr:hypothetical protein [Phyllobacteriaceae bacterium]
MHDIRTRSVVRRSPPRQMVESHPRPRGDLIDVFARLLPGVVVPPATFRSETALAGQLRVDPRRIREIRGARLVAPARVGRGWVYGPEEIRTLSVMLALCRLGATLPDLEAFFAGSLRGPDHGDDGSSRSPVGLCAAFCRRLESRMEEEIARLRALEALFEAAPDERPSPEASRDIRPSVSETIVK